MSAAGARAPRPLAAAAAAALGYALLTLLLTWPVAPRAFTHVPFYNDTWIFVWDVHWARAALLDPARELFFTDRVFHPEGISLAFHTLAPLYGALALPLEPALGLVATYNLLFLSTFVLSGLAMFGLARALTGSAGAAFVAGALFAFSPYHLAHAPHLNLLSIYFLPATAWLLLRLLATGGLGHALALAAAGGATFYACHEYALASVLLAALLLAAALARRARGGGGLPLAPLPDVLGRGLLAALLALLLVLPGLVPMLAEGTIERHYEERVDVQFSADLFSWITPSVLHSLWGGYTMKVYQHFPGVLAEWTTYVGVVVALLALVALRARRRLALAPWVAVAAAFALLAMGPSLRLLGRELPVPLPYRALKALPLVSALREPSRFAAVVTLATSVLAAHGFRELRAGRAGRLAWAALPLALLDFVQVPLATSPAGGPAFHARLAADREDYAVLEVPASLAFREHLFHQARHGKRLLLGYVARIPEANRRFLETLPLLEDPARWEISRARPGESAPGERFVRLAAALDVRYALVHEELYRRLGRPEGFAAAVASLSALPGARVVAREPGFVALRIDGR